MSIIKLQDVLFLCLCIAVHLAYRNRRTRLLPLPPGPSRWPIVGNTFMMPREFAHKFYKDLGAKLGSKIIYLKVFGMSIIVINDISMAQDLLEKRSALYSDRPPMPMLSEVIGFLSGFFSFMPYGNEWRIHRRMFQQYFSDKHLPRFQEKELEFVRKGLLPNLLVSPHELRDHIRNFIGGFSTSVTYGLPVQRQHDPLVNFSEHALAETSGTVAPGKYLVNNLPLLKYVPEWFPGAGFQTRAKEIRKELNQLMEEPYQATLKAMENDTAPPSFVSETLEKNRHKPDFELEAWYVKHTAMQVFGGISEASIASVMTFILGMLLHPDVQRKAQREIDSVVGPDRLPDFSDTPRLLYLTAIIKEVLRWNPITPQGGPRLTSEEDIYMGYFIPKNCMIVANTYAMLHNEEFFPDPTHFNPERFIKNGAIRDDVPDPEVVATFGFGRRACPGSHIARSTLTIVAASMLCLFDISPASDAEGKPIEVKPLFPGACLVSEPLQFQCKVTPRKDKDVGELLKEYMGTDPI